LVAVIPGLENAEDFPRTKGAEDFTRAKWFLGFSENHFEMSIKYIKGTADPICFYLPGRLKKYAVVQ
jgi:hypothetical protein